MKSTFTIIVVTFFGYILAFMTRCIVGDISIPLSPGNIAFGIVLSPYCMVMTLLYYHRFLPAWLSITTYLGFIIWVSALFLKPQINQMKYVKLSLVFIGSFSWNLCWTEVYLRFLTA